MNFVKGKLWETKGRKALGLKPLSAMIARLPKDLLRRIHTSVVIRYEHFGKW